MPNIYTRMISSVFRSWALLLLFRVFIVHLMAPGFQEDWEKKEVPKVLGFIGGSSDRPAPITEKEADRILQRVQEGVDKPRPKVLFEPGELVRVTDGPFNDFSGVVEQVNYEKSRLNVAVLIFGRSTPVELEFGQVEKA